MRPVRTVYSDEVHTSPDPAIDDLHTTRTEHGHQSVWIPTDEERAALAAGASVVLEVYATPHPAVSVAVGFVAELVDAESQEALERAAALSASGEAGSWPPPLDEQPEARA
jgi:hypothetical protein